MKTCLIILSLVTSTANIGLSQGTILWSESVSGELSNDFGSPSPLAPLQLGTNSIIAMTEVEPSGPNWTTDPDIFTLTVPSNLMVTAIYLQIDKTKVWAWIGDPAFLNQLGFIQNSLSGELLSQWEIGSIGSGIYGMYLENHDLQLFASVANYRLDFFVQAVPEPSAFSLLFIGAGLVGFRCWRKTRCRSR